MESTYDLKLYEVRSNEGISYLPILSDLPQSFVREIGLRLVKKYEALSPIKTTRAFIAVSNNKNHPREVVVSEIEKALGEEE